MKRAERDVRSKRLTPMQLFYSRLGSGRVLSGLQWLVEHWRRSQFTSEARGAVDEILPSVLSVADMPPPTTWAIQRILSTTNDVGVISLSSGRDETAVAVVKLARSSEAVTGLRREIEVLGRLTIDPRFEELRPMVPKILASGERRRHYFLVEEALPGVDARRVLPDAGAAERVRRAAWATVNFLHRRTASVVIVDRTLTDRWIDQPMCAVRALQHGHPAIARNATSIDRLAGGLREALLGRRVVVSWVHGDFSPGNIRVTPDGRRVTGIVDWENSTIDDLPMVDLIQLVLSTRVTRERRELGHVLGALLNGAGLTAQELSLLEMAQSSLGGDALSLRDLLLLSWLRHVADNLARSSYLNRHRWWVRENVENVLAYV